jgi:hypothetical protein
MSASTTPSILFEATAGVATITLNRPEVYNALDLPLADALVAALIRCDEDPSVRVVLLTGQGAGFCAGGDIGPMMDATPAYGGTPQYLKTLTVRAHAAVATIARMPKPVVAGVNGVAAGVGFSFAVACDLVVAAEDARFTARLHRDRSGARRRRHVLPATARRAEARLRAHVQQPSAVERRGAGPWHRERDLPDSRIRDAGSGLREDAGVRPRPGVRVREEARHAECGVQPRDADGARTPRDRGVLKHRRVPHACRRVRRAAPSRRRRLGESLPLGRLSFQEECLWKFAFATNLERPEVFVPGTRRRFRLGFTPLLELVEVFGRYLPIGDSIEEMLAETRWKIGPPNRRH